MDLASSALVVHLEMINYRYQEIWYLKSVYSPNSNLKVDAAIRHLNLTVLSQEWQFGDQHIPSPYSINPCHDLNPFRWTINQSWPKALESFLLLSWQHLLSILIRKQVCMIGWAVLHYCLALWLCCYHQDREIGTPVIISFKLKTLENERKDPIWSLLRPLFPFHSKSFSQDSVF